MDETTIQNAINQSREQKEIVACCVSGIAIVKGSIQRVVGDDFCMHPIDRDQQNREVIDAFGYDWRIRITILTEGQVVPTNWPVADQLTNTIRTALEDSDIVWSRYRSETINQLAEKIAAKLVLKGLANRFTRD